MKKWTPVAVLMLLSLCRLLFAQEVSLTDELKKQSMSLSFSQGVLHGPGADFLLNEGKSSRFVLVGEDHGLAEVPQFCLALFGELKKSGFEYIAVETGPLTAQLLEKMSREKDPVSAIRTFDQKYFYSIPFYNWQNEAEMLTSLAAGGMHIWGLDQEFILSSSFLLQRLVDLAPDANAKKVAGEYLARSLEGDRRMIAEKNPGVVFMLTATREDFEKLAAAFPDKNSEASRIVREMEVSWEIYAKNSQPGKGMDSNLQRAGLMKQHFHEYYDAAEKTAHPPKAVFKFGAYHAMRGRSLIGVHDLGNHVSELAEGQGGSSFHILVIVVKGTVNAFRPFGSDAADKQKPYDVIQEIDTADVRPLVEAAPASDWSVIDLRPVRRKISKLGTLNRGLEQILWGYDAVVLIPEGHAAVFLNN